MQLEDWLARILDHHARYHHHKEQVAFAAAGLYLAAISTIGIRGQELWTPAPPKDFLLWFVGTMGAIAGMFVVWQLRKRDLAYQVVRACTALITQNLAEPPQDPDLTPTVWEGNTFPAILTERLTAFSKGRTLLDGPRMSEAITYLVMASWTAGVFVRLCTTAA